MLKRILSLLLVFCLMSTAAALADTPDPVDILSDEEIPAVIDGQHHYLLLCTDQWRGDRNNIGNTDGIVLVTVDTRVQRVMLTSIIRDALVERPDGVIGRINYIAANFGLDELCKVISRHLGVKIEKYILFDFSQIANIVDHLGGVDITVTDAEASYLKRYAISPTSTKPSMDTAGTYRFNGHAAVIYMRIRKAGGGGDFMRTQRVRTVLSTLADQCRAITYEEARALVDSIMDNTTMTNMNLDEMVQAMNYAFDLRSCTVEELRIPVDGAYNPITYANMAVQEIDWKTCREAFWDYLQSSFLVLDDD